MLLTSSTWRYDYEPDYKRLLSFNAQVQGELAVVDKTNAQVQSFARVNFVDACEAAINEQIK